MQHLPFVFSFGDFIIPVVAVVVAVVIVVVVVVVLVVEDYPLQSSAMPPQSWLYHLCVAPFKVAHTPEGPEAALQPEGCPVRRGRGIEGSVCAWVGAWVHVYVGSNKTSPFPMVEVTLPWRLSFKNMFVNNLCVTYREEVAPRYL